MKLLMSSNPAPWIYRFGDMDISAPPDFKQTVFLDLDRTVFGINSGYSWLMYERAAGRVSYRKIIKGFWALARYSIGIVELEPIIREAISDYEGEREADLQARTDAFYRTKVVGSIRARARDVIARHKAQGHECVVLSTSTNYLAELVVKELGLDGALCTRLEVQDGLLTGRPSGTLCYGEGKLTLLKAHLKENGGRLADSYFYTDSYSDISALRAVGHPVPVCPDLRLKRYARRVGWSVQEW